MILWNNLQDVETEYFDDFGIDLYPIRKSNSSISLNNKNNDAVRSLSFPIIIPILVSNIPSPVMYTQQDFFYCVSRHYKETKRGYIQPEGSGISEAIQGGVYANFFNVVFCF